MDTSSESDPSPPKTITTTAIVHAEMSRLDTSVLDEITVVHDATPPKKIPVLPDINKLPELSDVHDEIVKISKAGKIFKSRKTADIGDFNSLLQKANKQEQSNNKKQLDFLLSSENNNIFDFGKKQRKLMSLQDVANLTKGKKRLSHNYWTRSNTSDVSGIIKHPTIDWSSEEEYVPKKRKSKVKTAKTRKRKLAAPNVLDDVLRQERLISDEEISEELYIEIEQPRVTKKEDLDLLLLTPPEKKSPQSPPKKISLLSQIVITPPKNDNPLSVLQGWNNYSSGNKDTHGRVLAGSKFGEKKVSKVPTITRISEINEGNLSPILGNHVEGTSINRPEKTTVSPHEEVIKGFAEFLNSFLPSIIKTCPNEMRKIKESLNKEDF